MIKDCRITTIWFCLPLIGLLSCSSKRESIVVSVEPPLVKKLYFKDIDTKKEGIGMDPSVHGSARTDWKFSICPELDFLKKKEKKLNDGYHVWIEITRVKLALALPIKILISDRAPSSVLDHENGHVKICSRVYERSRAIALDAARPVIGKQFEGSGADFKLAISDALRLAAQEIALPYRLRIASVADKVSQKYDYICSKAAYKNQVDDAIEAAFGQVEPDGRAEQPPP